MALTITDANFAETVLASEKLSVIDFWATWCGPCKLIAPIIDELSNELKDTTLIGKLDVDNNPEASINYGVRSIPTILFVKGGKEVGRHVGTISKDALKAKIAELA